MSIVREGYIFIFAAIDIAIILYFTDNPHAAIFFTLIALYFAYFFRNPKREIPVDENLIVSPADGTVQDVVELDDDDFVREPCVKVIIFLSVFDVHVNRAPISGDIKLQKYVCGRFRPAYKDSVGFENDRD